MEIYNLLKKQARVFADSPLFYLSDQSSDAVIYDNSQITYIEALHQVNLLVAKLESININRTHRVALALGNNPNFFLTLLALNCLDVGVVPLNMDQNIHEINHILTHSEASILLSADQYMNTFSKLASDFKNVLPVLRFQSNWEDEKSLKEGVRSTNEVAIVYTSGTTGAPKGCILSEDYFMTTGSWYRQIGGFLSLEPGKERILTPLPTSHVNSLVFSFMGVLSTGSCLVQLDRFHPSSWWDDVRKSEATAIHYLGVMPAILLSMPSKNNDYIGNQVKFGFGAGVEPDDHEEFEKRYGFPLVEGWAMTETGGAGCMMVSEDPRHVGTRCIGIPPSQLEYRIVSEIDEDVVSGEDGELLVRRAGANKRSGFFSGYFKDQSATNAVWAGGWLRTGDLVREGNDRSLFFVDRKKNIIRRSGENISVSEVEDVLSRSPLVQRCAVAPVKDSLRGEEVFALVILDHNARPSLKVSQSIFEFSRKYLSYFKSPAYIAFVDTIPVTGNQKISRSQTKKLSEELFLSGKVYSFISLKRRGEG